MDRGGWLWVILGGGGWWWVEVGGGMILSNPKLNTLEDGLVILWGLMLSYLTTNTASSRNAKRSELY